MILGNGHPGRGHLGGIWAAREKMPDPSDSFFTDLGREQTGTMVGIARTGPVMGSRVDKSARKFVARAPCAFQRHRHSRAMPKIVLMLLLLLPAALRAQPLELDPAALRDAALGPYLERSAYLDLLADTVDGFRANPARRVPGLADDDIYFWSVTGRFGADFAGSSVPGGILACGSPCRRSIRCATRSPRQSAAGRCR